MISLTKKPNKDDTKPDDKSGEGADKLTEKNKEVPAASAAGIESETTTEASVHTRRPLPARGNGIPGLLWTLMFLAVIMGGGYATLPLWSPFVIDFLPALERSDGRASPTDVLDARLAGMEQELAKVRESGGSIQDLEAERGRLDEQLQTLMARLNVIEGEVGDVRKMIKATENTAEMIQSSDSLERLSGRLSRLEENGETFDAIIKRLGELETAVATNGSDLEAASPKLVKAQSLVLAVSYLRETLSTSAPFTRALEAVKALGGDNPNFLGMVGELDIHAGSGIPTVKMLYLELDTAARAIAAAAPVPAPAEPIETTGEGNEPDSGLLAEALNKIKSLVTVRRVSTEPSPFAGNLIEASESIGKGDLKAAVNIIAAIDGPAAEAAKPWLNRARARLAADTAIASLHVYAISLLTTKVE